MQFVGPSNLGPGMQMGSMDDDKLDEIRRTIYVGNLDSKTIKADQISEFFSSCGEVKFVQLAGEESQPTRFAFVEFAHVDHVQKAMTLNETNLGGRPIKINHSNNAVVKPSGKKEGSNSREIDEAMRRVREAQTLISRALEPDSRRSRKRSRSRSRSHHRRHRSRSRDRSRRRRSKSRERSRRRSRSRDRRRSRRSRSRSRKKQSRSYKRSSSRSPSKKSSSSKSHRKDKKREHKQSERKDDKKSKEANKENGTPMES